MDLQINSKSHVPVHVQLEEQLKHLILSERFEVGESVRDFFVIYLQIHEIILLS